MDGNFYFRRRRISPIRDAQIQIRFLTVSYSGHTVNPTHTVITILSSLKTENYDHVL
jgi:hypothetical protein